MNEWVVLHKMVYTGTSWKCPECGREFRIYPYMKKISEGDKHITHKGGFQIMTKQRIKNG